MNLFWFNLVVIGLVLAVVLLAWLRSKLKRTTLHVHDPGYYTRGTVVRMTHGSDTTYNGRYKVLRINEDRTVTARKTFRQ